MLTAIASNRSLYLQYAHAPHREHACAGGEDVKIRQAKKIVKAIGAHKESRPKGFAPRPGHEVFFSISSGPAMPQIPSDVRMPRRDRLSKAVDIVNRSERRRWFRHVLPNLKSAY